MRLHVFIFPMIACYKTLSEAQGAQTWCGWEPIAGQCNAGWLNICESLLARVQLGEFGVGGAELTDGWTLRWLTGFCGTTCWAIEDAEACSLVQGCRWLEFPAASGVEGECMELMKAVTLQQISRLQLRDHPAEVRQMERSLMAQFDRYDRECSQFGLQNEDACTRYGPPCIWVKIPGRLGTESCICDYASVIEESAPNVAEFLLLDHYCAKHQTQQECLQQGQLTLRDFQLMQQPASHAKLVGILFSAMLAVLMAMFCRMPPRPSLGSDGRRKRRIIQMLSATRSLTCVGYMLLICVYVFCESYVRYF